MRGRRRTILLAVALALTVSFPLHAEEASVKTVASSIVTPQQGAEPGVVKRMTRRGLFRRTVVRSRKPSKPVAPRTGSRSATTPVVQPTPSAPVVGPIVQPVARPTIALDSPSEGETVTSSTVVVRYRITSNASQVDHVHVKIDDFEQLDRDLDGLHEFRDVANGVHTITVWAGKCGEEQESEHVSHTFVVQMTAPPQGEFLGAALDADRATIGAGESVELSWRSTAATKCQASGGWTGARPTQGHERVTLARTTAFSLSCTGTDGASVGVGLTVTVIVPREKLATGKEIYNNINLPWGKFPNGGGFTYTFGMDFGFSPLTDAKRVSDNPQIAQDLDALHQVGVEGVRWFLIPDGRNLTFDAQRVPTGRGAGFREDLFAALDLLSARQMSVVFMLIDGNTWFKPEGEFQGALFGHAKVILEPAKRQAFYQTVLIPILKDFIDWQRAHPQEPLPVAGIDLGNELELGLNDRQGTGVAITDVQTYVREAADLVHFHLPGVPVTVGASDAKSLVQWWTNDALSPAPGQELDFYSFHHYGSEPLETLRAQFGLDRLGKRVYLQEYPGKNAPLGGPEVYLAPVGGTRNGHSRLGWLSGGWLWSFNGASDGLTPDDPLVILQRIADWFATMFG